MSATLVAPCASAFDTHSPRMSPDAIRGVLLENYGIRGEVRFLTSERDLTVHVIEVDGNRQFVFKVANISEDPSIVDFQIQALDHIAAMPGEVPVPRVIRALDGSAQIRVEIDGQPHVARMLSYLPGVPAHMTESSGPQRRSIGNALARLSVALTGFTHPAARHEILWDLKQTEKLEQRTGSINDPAKRKLVEQIFTRFRERVKPIEPALRHQVVHNDFNLHNILVDPDEHDRVCGILDFGDIVDTPLIYDVAVGCSYHVPERGHPLSYVTEVLSAYHAVYPLREEEIDLLYDLINTRNAMTVTITEWRSKLYPENSAYILRNNGRATLALQQYATISEVEARSIFRSACGF